MGTTAVMVVVALSKSTYLSWRHASCACAAVQARVSACRVRAREKIIKSRSVTTACCSRARSDTIVLPQVVSLKCGPSSSAQRVYALRVHVASLHAK